MRRSARTSLKRVLPQSDSDSSENEEEIPKKLKRKQKQPAIKLESSGSSSEYEVQVIRKIKKPQKSSSSVNNAKNCARVKKEGSDGSSSESDIENYLKPAHEIDFNSTFFDVVKPPEKKAFESLESKIFDGVNIDRLSESGSESDSKVPEEPIASTSKADFHQLQEYTQRMEEAKKAVEQYEANLKSKQAKESKGKKKKQKNDEQKLDILSMLAQGETRANDVPVDSQTSMHSSDYESCSDSEKEDWHEIEGKAEKEAAKSIIPKAGLEVTVALPGATVQKKKKEDDVLASIKRRLNRVRKENQVLVHKVHLLCWIAHGNFVNKVLNNENLMALALSLIPSQHCYPPARADLNYLEQIVKWYRNIMPIVEKEQPSNMGLEDFLKLQINIKKAYSKKMLVYIFICIMRSLGIHCRLVLSFQITPLRPPSSELHSLSSKNDDKDNKLKKPRVSGSKEPSKDSKEKEKRDKPISKILNSKSGDKSPTKVASTIPKSANAHAQTIKSPEVATRTRGKSASTINNNKDENVKVRRSHSTNDDVKAKKQSSKVAEKSTKPKLGNLLKVPQTDGPNDSDEEPKSSKMKPNLKRLSLRDRACCKKEPQVASSPDTSDDDFRGYQTTKAPNLKQLKNTKPRAASQSSTTKSAKEAGSKEQGRTRRSGSTASTSKDIKATTTKEVKGKKNVEIEKSKSTSSTNKSQRKSNSNVETEKSKPASSKKKGKEIIKYKSLTSTHKDDNKPNEEDKVTNGTKLRSKSTRSSKKADTGNNAKPKSKSTRAEAKTPKNPARKPNLSSVNGLDVRNDIISIMKGRIAQERETERVKTGKSRKAHHSSDEDSDYVPVSTKKKYDSDDEYYKETKVKVKQRVKPRKELEAMQQETKTKKGFDVWIEVFLEAEEKWVSVDLVKGQVHCVSEIYARASHPVTYIVAWNNDSTIKDISQRYCPNWNTVTRLLRIDKNWWNETLKPFMGCKNARDKEEDEELALFHLEKPLPKAITEYKNHPLYALKRHLLKYQVFYPPNPVTLGFVRGEPVYSRDCVKTVCSREKWYKEAKVVKAGEQPYKIVYRTTYDKYKKDFVKNQPLDVFGEWQIEDYVPPPAVNGIVPKNEYGNVEIFKECMIPGGTVHLKLPGLNKIAYKMGIDCPAAMVGFDIHHGWTHPMFDGFIVCEEHAETLIAAWHMVREEQEEKEKEKYEKRVYDNWKKLIKGLLIRERLKKRYNFGETKESEGEGGKKRKAKGPKFTCKKRRLASQNESDTK